MINVVNLKVASFSKDVLDITWEIEDTSEDPRDFDFFIERSESEVGPFETIGGPLVDRFMFRFQDSQAPQYYRGRQHLYRIRAVKRTTGQEIASDAVQALPDADLVTLEIRRLEFLRLLEFTGRRVIVFQRRTFGQRCGNCWDKLKGRTSQSSCQECFGTGFVPPYFQPFQVLLQIDPSIGLIGQSQKITTMGEVQHNLVMARAPIFPLFKAKDMVVERENVRWRIVGTATYQHLRSPAAQQMTMIQIPETDVEYRIPVNGVDAVDFQPTADRAFTNSTNIDAVREGPRRTSL